MRHMSFALTEAQVLTKTKTVTRRVGWMFLQPGDLVQPVRKGMGLKKGEKVVKLGPPIRVVEVSRERLSGLIDEVEHGLTETTREGFPEGHPKHSPTEFVLMFCATHGCEPDDIVTRIEFEYTT